MKITEFKKLMMQADVSKLHEELNKLKQELFRLRLSVFTSHVKNYAQFKQYRKNIARVLTMLKQKSGSAMPVVKGVHGGK